MFHWYVSDSNLRNVCLVIIDNSLKRNDSKKSQESHPILLCNKSFHCCSCGSWPDLCAASGNTGKHDQSTPSSLAAPSCTVSSCLPQLLLLDMCHQWQRSCVGKSTTTTDKMIYFSTDGGVVLMEKFQSQAGKQESSNSLIKSDAWLGLSLLFLSTHVRWDYVLFCMV